MNQQDWANLIEFNTHVLRQAEQAIDLCVKTGIHFPIHVGPHLRHVIEHYEALIRGLGDVQIDYDARERNRVFEREPQAARARIGLLIDEIRSMWRRPQDQAVRVAFEGGPHGEFQFSAHSTLSRELLFLPHHAIHHFALIRSFLASLGVSLDAGFGLAPATIKHANRVAA